MINKNKDEEIILAPETNETIKSEKVASALTLELKAPTKNAVPVSELTELRGVNKKVFRMSDGTEKCVFYAEPVHVFNETTGIFEEVDNSLSPDEDQKHFIGGKNHFMTRFSNDDKSDELFTVEKGNYRITVSTLVSGRKKKRKNKPKLVKKSHMLSDALLIERGNNNADLEYSISSRGVKENIIINEEAEEYKYQFVVYHEDLDEKLEADTKNIVYTSRENGEEVFRIPAPFMIDAEGEISQLVDYELTYKNNDETLLTVIASSEWINDVECSFPVVIDPQIIVNASMSTSYTLNNGYLSSSVSPLLKYTGDCAFYPCFSAWMPSIETNATIKKAILRIKQRSASTACYENPIIALYQCYGLYEGSYTECSNQTLIDYTRMITDENGEYAFDITQLIDQVYEYDTGSFDFMLRFVGEDILLDSVVDFYGAGSGTENAPTVEIIYEKNYSTNLAGKTHSHNIGRFGNASVDLKSGALVVESEDFAWGGNRMPVTISHLFHSHLSDINYSNNNGYRLCVADYSAMKLGLGWRLNLMQSMVEGMFAHDGENCLGYIFTDETGNETYFKRKYNEVGCYYEDVYQDIENDSVEYDPCTRIMSGDGEIKQFDSKGRLLSVTDESHPDNKMEIKYTDDKITSVVDGVGRIFNLAYNENDELKSITAPDGTAIEYTYCDNCLKTVKYPDGRSVDITVSENKPSVILLKDSAENNVYKLEYSYSVGKVSEVKEYGVNSNGAFVQGAVSAYIYSAAARRTTVRTTEAQDENETVDNVITSVYTFNEDCELHGQYVYSGELDSHGVINEGSGINPYTENGMTSVKSTNNLLFGQYFYGSSAWNKMPNNDTNTSYKTGVLSSATPYGNKILILECVNSQANANGVYQEITNLEKGQYTFSLYTKVTKTFTGTENPGAYLRVVSDGTIISESEHIADTNGEYVRMIAHFDLDSTKNVSIQILLDGAGYIYGNAAQLEAGGCATAFNMLKNNSFISGFDSWTSYSGATVSEETSFSRGKSAALVGDVGKHSSIYQSVDVCADASTRETFTLSGWAKADALTDYERDGVANPTFRLRATVSLYDNYNKYVSTDEYVADFSPCTDGWQYASVTFAKSKFLKVKAMTVYCEYRNNRGIAYFDDIQLIRDSIEYNLTSADFTDVSEDDEAMTSEYTEEALDSAPSFGELVDAFGNSLTETMFTDGEFGTIYRSYNYSENGNDVICETDSRGAKTEYIVDDATSRNKEIIDRLGNKTVYDYDNAGRTAKVTNKNASGVELANVSYDYDAFDNLSKIVRGDGMEYALKYNEFHNLESIGVNGKSDPLIKYMYKNGNGRLKEIAYANGDTMTITYNATGQVIAEKWHDSSNNLVAHYKYAYDGDGNVIRSLDILTEREYNYTYKDGNVINSTEYILDLNEVNENIVSSKTKISATHYSYNSENQLIKKTVIINGEEFVYYYEHSEDGNTTVKFDTVTSHSKTDSFGRKVFDELQHGAGFVSRRFDYVTGQVTEEHLEGKKLKSSPTTQLVSSIILSDGRTIEYEYDAEERITKVIDSVDGTTEYTYDALGQLITERCNGHIVNSMTYDTYGNILSKNGSVYTYGDTDWRDLLTAVDGRDIVYDKQGNPTEYLGHNLTWEKGRQLKSYDNNTYTYNANGIRTSKTVNGVTHTYTLDGTKILREAWDGNTLIPLYDNEECVCGIKYNGTSYFFLKNLQGDIISITDDKGESVAQYTYDAWGVCTILSDTTGIIARVNPYRYRGYYYDEEIAKYYLQSRYYDATAAKFLNSDNIDYLGLAGTAASYNLFTYCENDGVDFVDYFGHSPSLSTLTKMHNAVVQSAQSFLFSVGTITASEVRTCNNKGKYNGRMDIYSYISNRVWEVKRNNSTGINAGLSQLGTYTSSYIYSLYHAWFRIKQKPKYGNISVYGSIVVSNYLVTYRSYSGNRALIVYDYMSLERAAELLFSAVMATSAAFATALARCAKKTREKVNAILAQVKKFLGNAVRATQKVLNDIGDFLKKAGPIILIIVALVIFLCTGIPVPA